MNYGDSDFFVIVTPGSDLLTSQTFLRVWVLFFFFLFVIVTPSARISDPQTFGYGLPR